MPYLDVSEALTDPDFYEGGLLCLRSVQSVGANGLAVNTPTSLPFGGVVTQVGGSSLNRNEVGEFVSASILICTKFRLFDGKYGTPADIVQRGTRSYTVKNVLPYSKYGTGFVEATCDLLPLSGSYAPVPGTSPTDNNE